MSMARATTADPGGHLTTLNAMVAEAAALHRGLFDACGAVTILSRLPGGDARRDVAITSERARAVDLVARYRAAVDRLIEATTEGVL